jgi:hypothetical protein
LKAAGPNSSNDPILEKTHHTHKKGLTEWFKVYVLSSKKKKKNVAPVSKTKGWGEVHFQFAKPRWGRDLCEGHRAAPVSSPRCLCCAPGSNPSQMSRPEQARLVPHPLAAPQPLPASRVKQAPRM